MGCFMDSRENRLLRGHAGQLRRNTPNLCCDICFQRGYMYAGVEYGYVERGELGKLFIEYLSHCHTLLILALQVSLALANLAADSKILPFLAIAGYWDPKPGREYGLLMN